MSEYTVPLETQSFVELDALEYTILQGKFTDPIFVSKFVKAVVAWNFEEYCNVDNVKAMLLNDLRDYSVTETDKGVALVHNNENYWIELSSRDSTYKMDYEPIWGTSVSCKVSLMGCDILIRDPSKWEIRWITKVGSKDPNSIIKNLHRAINGILHVIIVPTLGVNYVEHLNRINKLKETVKGIWVLLYKKVAPEVNLKILSLIFTNESVVLLDINNVVHLTPQVKLIQRNEE